MIGLSLSFCVRDLAKGKISLANVDKIIAGTRASSWRKMNLVIRRYEKSYWHKDPECGSVARQLVSNTKRAKRGQDPRGPVIEQPRLYGAPAPSLVGPNGLRHWVNTESEIQWCD